MTQLSPTWEGLRPEIRLTVDTPDELQRMAAIYDALAGTTTPSPWSKYMNSASGGPPSPDAMGRERHPRKLAIGPIVVGDGEPCCIAAEIGQNHNGDIGIARRLIDTAALSDATVVKFQKRDVESELSVELRDKPYENENSFVATYGEHRRFLELSWQQHRELQQYAQEKGILYLCDDLRPGKSPADGPPGPARVQSRVARFDELAALAALAELHRPIILSTGMAGEREVDEAIEIISRRHDQIIVAQCTSEYPCPPEHVNLRAMETYRRRYGLLVGMSDHTAGIIPAVAAAVMGACYVEKHITLSRAMRGRTRPGPWSWRGCAAL